MCENKSIRAGDVFVIDEFQIASIGGCNAASRTLVLKGVDSQEYASNEPINLFSDLLSHGQSDWVRLTDESMASNTPAAYYLTSGTTGLPKLATLSHYSLKHQHQSLYEKVPHDVVRLACLPLFHIFGAAWALVYPVRYGQPVYIMYRFELDDYVRNIHSYAVTETYMAPPMVHALNSSDLPLDELLSSLRYIGVGGAAIDADTMSKLSSRLHPQATVTQVWGLTEFGPATLFRWAETVDKRSVGRLLPGYDIKLVDSEGDEIHGSSEPGSIFIRAPGAMMGYRGISMSEEDKCWFPTGDIGRVQDGMLYVTGRSKEMIKVKG